MALYSSVCSARAGKCTDLLSVFSARNSVLDTCHTALSSLPILTQGVKWEGQSRLLLLCQSCRSVQTHLAFRRDKERGDIWSARGQSARWPLKPARSPAGEPFLNIIGACKITLWLSLLSSCYLYVFILYDKEKGERLIYLYILNNYTRIRWILSFLLS